MDSNGYGKRWKKTPISGILIEVFISDFNYLNFVDFESFFKKHPVCPSVCPLYYERVILMVTLKHILKIWGVEAEYDVHKPLRS